MLKALNYIVYLIFRAVWIWGKILPMKPVFALARLLGNLGYYLLPGRRKIALRNLEIAFGKDKTEAERRRICRSSFISLCYSGAEFFFIERITRNWEKHFTFQGDRMIDDCIRSHQAFFVFGGHLGGWMMISMVPRRFGVSGGVVIRPQRNPYIDRFLRQLVAKYQGLMINTRGTGKQIEKMIMQGNLIGFYMDQQSRRKQGIPVDFFGIPAYSHIVPGYLAWKHRIPMFPFWMPRTRPGQFTTIFRKPVEFVYSGDQEKDIQEVTRRIVKEIENTIREYPEQWLWAHNRWSRTLGGEKVSKKRRKKQIAEGVYLTSKEILKQMDQEMSEDKDEGKTGSP